ncbi:MAG TPA: energy transducer TonB [Myxococcota bacterium]|nr:energy transducer TonB [Myxococcota bacterium]
MSATLDMATESRRQFRRMVVLSAALHVGLSVAAMISWPSWRDAELPAGPVITMITPAELAARTTTAAPKPAPPKVETKPEPEPQPVVEPPPPPPQPAEQIIIPEDTNRKPAPKPKPEVQREPEPEPEPQPKPREPEPQPEQQIDLEEWLAQEKAKEDRPSPIETAAATKPAMPVPGAGGTGAPDSPEVAAWKQKVRAHVRRTLNLPPGFRGKALKTQVTVTLTSSGDLLGFEVDRGSGNPWYDDQIERYLTEEDALPAPPSAGDWALIFDGDL